jgi:hypothetical protein
VGETLMLIAALVWAALIVLYGAKWSFASSLRRMRRRNGARRWALLHDAADPEVWIERFETPSWLDHLRVRDRMTVVDREVEGRILAFHKGEGPPFSRYLLAHMPVEADADHGPDLIHHRI